jgi:5'-3' exonuclease
VVSINIFDFKTFFVFLSTDNNFRYQLATVKPYKGNRKHVERPFHYDNIRAWIPMRWETIICDGYEADDGFAMYQTKAIEKGFETIICSRDKDLRQVAGWHYTWGRGGQDEIPPGIVEEFGHIVLHEREVVPISPDKKPYKAYKIKGDGLKFFYAQCVMGDPVDNIPGLKGAAAVAAYNLLKDCNSEVECHKAVLTAYNNIWGEDGKDHLLEQARLLWLIRETNNDGSLKMWEHPNY